MKTYIGCKIIQGEPMSHNDFLVKVKGKRQIAVDEPGYKVVYPDGYESWSPKEVFENARIVKSFRANSSCLVHLNRLPNN